MNRITAAVFAALALAVAVPAGFFFFKKPGPRAPVTVTLHLQVAPPEQAGFAAAQAASARFKYEIGRKAGLKPSLAQHLSVQAMTNTSVLTLRIGVQTREQGRRYAEAFVETLQAQCGKRTELALLDSVMR